MSCVCVFPRPSSATDATKRQSRHTGGLSIVFASVLKRRFSYNRFLDFSCYSPCYKSAILFLCACVYIQRMRGRSLSRGAHVNLEANRVVDFSSVRRNRQSGMSMRLKKVCPQCDATLHVTLHVCKLACPCGHVFPAKAWCI